MGLKVKLVGILCASTALGSAAFAQQADTVVVEATRLGQTQAEAGTAITVITSADIERRGLSFAQDAIATAPGVTVTQSGAFGGIAYARMRGGNGGQTLVLVDGVPVNDASAPGGEFDFGTFDLADVDRIEILRGPQSTLWGSDAIGGVISIATRKPEQGFGWRAEADAGSFESYRTAASISGANDRADGLLSASWRTTEGISKADKRDGNAEKDGFESLTVSGRGGFDLSQNIRADFTARWTDAEYDADGFPPPLFDLADTAATSQAESLSSSATLRADAFSGRLQNTLQVTYYDIDREDDDGAGFVTPNSGNRTTYRYSGALDIADGHRTLFGVEHEQSEAASQEAEASSIFALYEWKPVEALTLTGGLRHDDDDRYGSETTGKVAASWQATDAIRLRAAWGQGFKAPTIFQSTFICTFCGLTAPNSNLRAETSESIEAGADLTLGDAQLSLTAFDTETEDMIDFSFTAGYDNIALAKQRGVELELSAPLTSWLEARASYAYIDAENAMGGPLPRVPLHSGTAELILRPVAQLEASLAVRHNGDQSDGFGPDVPAWTRVDLAGTWELSPQAELYARVENLFDEAYQQIGGYGTPGISGLVGFRLRK
jgi:vitamin B12 transporter